MIAPVNLLQDINECKVGKSSCDTEATCINKPGTYKCECREGYVGNGYSCEG